MKAVIYARYSSENQTEKSIEGQIKENREFAVRNNIEVIKEYTDRAISGRKEDRPQFQQMIADAKKKQFNYVIVWKMDRFARDRYIFAVYKRELKKYGVSVISAMENINTNTPEGAMFEGILESWAEYYSANLSQNVKRGMNLLQQEAKYVGGHIPIGLLVNDEKKFVIDPLTNKFVKDAFIMCKEGCTIKSIIEYFEKNGIKNCYNNKHTHNTVTRMLRDKKYIGIYESGKHYFEDAIDPTIDKKTFYTVQDILDAKKHTRGKKEDSNFLLSGKLICGECGSHIIGESGTSKTKKKHYYYKCSGAKKHNCDVKAIRKLDLENYIATTTIKELDNIEIIETISKQLYESYKTYREDDSALKSIEKQLKQVNKSLDNYLTAIERGIFNETIQDRMLALENEKKILEKELAKEQIKKPEITLDLIEYNLCRLFDKKDFDNILNLFIKSIVIYNNKIDITFTGIESPVSVRLDSKWQE